MSYSWDSRAHQDWVLQLATRLRHDGVDVVLDRWDTRVGSDLILYMDRAANVAYRVIAIVTTKYKSKADAAEGGVGYERRVITPSIMSDLHGHRVIPVLRDNPLAEKPAFLGAARHIDMRDDEDYEKRYYELLQELYGMPATPKPPLGKNPFVRLPEEEVPLALSHDPARYAAPALESQVTFNYDNNNGRYTIGTGERKFTLAFSTAGHGSIHMYTDPSDIKTLALARGVSRWEDVGDASAYDASSRVRTVKVGDAGIWRNEHDYWAAVFVDKVTTRETSRNGEPSITFRYFIPPVPAPDFGAR